MGRRLPDGGLLRYRKWVPQQLGDVNEQGSGNSRPMGEPITWICSPGAVELVYLQSGCGRTWLRTSHYSIPNTLSLSSYISSRGDFPCFQSSHFVSKCCGRTIIPQLSNKTKRFFCSLCKLLKLSDEELQRFSLNLRNAKRVIFLNTFIWNAGWNIPKLRWSISN